MNCCPALTPEMRALLEAQLAEAMKAYHSVQLGGAVREFTDQNGERIVYNAANRSSLMAYINQLRAQLGLPPMCGIVAPPAGVFL